MGVCVNIFGIPILEDKECADARRNDRNKRKSIEEASDVEKKRIEESSDVQKTIARNYGTGETPLEGIVSAPFNFLSGAVDTAGGLLAGATIPIPGIGDVTLGGGSTETTTDILPYVGLAALLGVGALVASRSS